MLEAAGIGIGVLGIATAILYFMWKSARSEARRQRQRADIAVERAEKVARLSTRMVQMYEEKISALKEAQSNLDKGETDAPGTIRHY